MSTDPDAARASPGGADAGRTGTGVDPSKPLKPPAREIYVQHRVRGLTQRQAYIRAYPQHRKVKPETLDVKACELEATDKVGRRLEWLQQQNASKAVGDLQARRELLWKTIQECKVGLHPYVQALPDGDMVFDVTRDNLTFAIETIEQRLETTGEGDGRRDATIRKIRVRDYLSYLQELNKLDKLYVERHEQLGPDGKPVDPTSRIILVDNRVV
jgi:hypothetical protein